MFDTGSPMGSNQDLAEAFLAGVAHAHDEAAAAAEMVERRDDTPGLVFFPADRVPAWGEVIKRGSGIRCEVSDVESRRISACAPATCPAAREATEISTPVRRRPPHAPFALRRAITHRHGDGQRCHDLRPPNR